MKILIAALLFSVQGLALAPQNEQMVPVEVASLTACPSRTLNIELNVDGRTPKSQLIEAVNVLADSPTFTVRAVPSANQTLLFQAYLNAQCLNDGCARAYGWFELQYRLEHFRGVAVSCATPSAPSAPRMPAPHAPGAPAPGGGANPNQPPPPGDGGVTSGN